MGPRGRRSSAGSATDQLLQMFRMAGSLHRNSGDCALDVAKILGREFHGCRADVPLIAGVQTSVHPLSCYILSSLCCHSASCASDLSA
jgi:hypothetical protein